METVDELVIRRLMHFLLLFPTLKLDYATYLRFEEGVWYATRGPKEEDRRREAMNLFEKDGGFEQEWN